MINITASSRYRIDRKSLKKMVTDYMMAKKIHENIVINLIFVGRNKMKQLSLAYKKENEALPVLSFPYKETNKDNEELLGEIIICYPQAVLLAAERNKKVYQIIFSLIQHGIDNLLM